jgi:hypothetical protein
MAFTSPFEGKSPALVIRDAEKFASALSIPSLKDEEIDDVRRIQIDTLERPLYRILRYLSLPRLYYYQVAGCGSATQESLIEEILSNISKDTRFGLRRSELIIAGLLQTEERIYVPLLKNRTPREEEGEFDVEAVVVFRIGSPVAVLRVSSDDTLDAAEQQFQSITGNLLETPELVTFNPTFHEEFERQFITRYSELWIDVSTDENINKVHLTSSQWGDPRESEIARDLLSGDSKNRIVSGRVTLNDGTDLYFQWEQSRTSVMSDGNSTLNQVADYVRRTLIKFVIPPTVRIVNVAERPMRLEAYDEYYAATWASNFSMDQFLMLCEQIDIDSEAQFTVDTEGEIIGQGPWQQREEALELDERFTFLRVDGHPFSLVWERRNDWNLVSVISDNQPENLTEMYEEIEDEELTEETAGFVRDYLVGRTDQ